MTQINELETSKNSLPLSQSDGSTVPRVLFWPLGNPEMKEAVADAAEALKNIKNANVSITAIEEMTWWEPKQIPRLARSVKKDQVDLVVIFAATFATVLCSTSIVKHLKIPALIWAVPSRYALATSGLASSFLGDRGYRVRLTCHEPGDSTVRSEVETVARAARAYHQFRKNKIGIIGKRSPLMISLPYDLELLKRKLGVTTQPISLPTLDKALKSVSQKEIESTVSEFEQRFRVNVSREALSKAVRFQLAVRKIVAQNKLDGIALECWTNLFPKYGVNPCLGHLDDLAVGCEGDVVSLTGSLILKSINGITPFLTDILGVDQRDNSVTLAHCAAPISLAKDPNGVEIGERPDQVRKGKTAFVHVEFRNGPVTLVRFYGERFDKIHMTFGDLLSTSDYVGSLKMAVASKGNVPNFLKNICGNHYLVTYGDVREELRLFGSWNGFEVKED